MTVSIQPLSGVIAGHLQPPVWATRLAGKSRAICCDGFEMTLAESDGAALASIHLPRVTHLDAGAFERLVGQAYGAMRGVLAPLKCSHPVRFWNHLPGIHQPMDAGRDRYMVFNAARYHALAEWFGAGGQLPSRLPAASGVGHDGEDLVIHCLAFVEPGRAVENPRQIPAFRYSRQYGPLPPCFSRATAVNHPGDGRAMLLIAGTASIRGQVSVHENNLSRQFDETIENLRSLLDSWMGGSKKQDPHPSPLPGYRERGEKAPLNALADLRIYYTDAAHRVRIIELLDKTFSRAVPREMIPAQLCRSELLIEIEGIAMLDRASGR